MEFGMKVVLRKIKHKKLKIIIILFSGMYLKQKLFKHHFKKQFKNLPNPMKNGMFQDLNQYNNSPNILNKQNKILNHNNKHKSKILLIYLILNHNKINNYKLNRFNHLNLLLLKNRIIMIGDLLIMLNLLLLHNNNKPNHLYL